MSKVTEINNFLNELQKSHNTIHQVDLDTMDYYIDNISNIRLQSGIDEETKDEIEALQNKLISICGRIKAIANRYNQSAEALVVAIATAKKLGTNLVAYSKLDTKVFADALPERNDKPDDYEVLFEYDINKVINELERADKFNEEVKEGWEKLYKNDSHLAEYDAREIENGLIEWVLYDEFPEVLEKFLKDYNLNVSAGKYAGGDSLSNSEIKEIADEIIKNPTFKNKVVSSVKEFLAKQ